MRDWKSFLLILPARNQSRTFLVFVPSYATLRLRGCGYRYKHEQCIGGWALALFIPKAVVVQFKIAGSGISGRGFNATEESCVVPAIAHRRCCTGCNGSQAIG
ncbi:uncharacterized protein PHALS_08779 [Plasmopara halstedii]|uniref:Uncharacterized protein n=1 Tax=Plasmopara halstedii TaxID=4781 RepID=A0A0P1ACX8_PLAHL|nr:uncharacterized protein PHALS_08779 [Plasmopara halstedii]CEG38722.1 hypothetical protein PHALS_08779 [Plasmopara halstedii]|eukprot:XP_024575091.1 hypothetical protein PHALS_08779 [Plasmopara halstedii]